MPRPKSNSPKKASAKRGPGQPEKQLDLKTLTALCQLQCSTAEIAAVMDCSEKTIERHKLKYPEVQEAMDRGKLKGCVSLRRVMFQSALNGNVTSQIWLSKNHLGMRDRFPDEAPNATPVDRIEYRWVDPPKEEPADPKDTVVVAPDTMSEPGTIQ